MASSISKLKVQQLLPSPKILDRLYKEQKLPHPLHVAKIIELCIQGQASKSTFLSSLINNTVCSANDVFQIAQVMEVKAKKTINFSEGVDIAHNLYRISASMGSDVAKLKYAQALFKCKVTHLSTKESIKQGRILLKEAADSGLADAQYAYALNSASNKSYNDAFYYMQKAADNDFGLAMFQVGHWYKTGEVKGVQPKKSFEYITKAHEKGVVEATFLLSGFYESAFGTSVDIEKSVLLMTEASRKGLSVAQHNMGTYYLEGKGSIKPNLTLAIEYFQMAATRGFQLSILNLCEIYLKGHGTLEPDLGLARMYLYQVQKWERDDLEKKAEELKGLLEVLEKMSVKSKATTCIIL